MFANGPHAGTQAFEIGDVNLKTERSTSVEATCAAAARVIQSRLRSITAGSAISFTKIRPA
jgi:outer membrane receptor protein involved in Fe transport